MAARRRALLSQAAGSRSLHARDRPALLFSLANALFQSKVTVHSAHVATYGERAVDTFYVTDLLGHKVDGKARMRALEARLIEAVSGPGTLSGAAA